MNQLPFESENTHKCNNAVLFGMNLTKIEKNKDSDIRLSLKGRLHVIQLIYF